MPRFVPSLVVLLSVPLSLLAGVIGARAEGVVLDPYDAVFYMDFDNDGSPWTLRTAVLSDSCQPFNLILQVPENPPFGFWYWAIIRESKCEYYDSDSLEQCWYRCRLAEMEFDPRFVSEGQINRLPEPGCHNWEDVEFTLAEDAPLVPGERVVLGTGLACPSCGDPPPDAEECPEGPRNFGLWFKPLPTDHSPEMMQFFCPTLSGTSGSREGGFALGRVRPNPVAGGLRFSVRLDALGWMRLTIHDVAGRTLATLFEGEAGTSERPFAWDVRQVRSGRGLPDGVYYVRLERDGRREVRPFVVVR
jgi:hypothetical protein